MWRSSLRAEYSGLHTPCFVIERVAIERNLKRLDEVQQRTGCRIILALKGFACFHLAPLVMRYLKGVTASSLDEARLGRESFGGEVHVCGPAYRDDEFDELVSLADHIVFNSFSQWARFKSRILSARKRIACGIRINPRHSEVRVQTYDPCQPGSRLGVPRDQFDESALDGITGLHFHALCELNADALERTLVVVERDFGAVIRKMRWMDFGGGHHITRADYDVDGLCRLITSFRERYDGIEVYLEPGEAVALNAGVLVSRVLDVIRNDVDIAVLDTSASTHMPDVLEMPYRPAIEGAGKPGEYAHTYRLGGMSCLAGDIIGDYSFREPLQPGSLLVFKDMAHYSMVKTNTFNGIRLPSIAIEEADGRVDVVRTFGYEDFKSRLG